MCIRDSSDGTRSSALLADLAEQSYRLGAITLLSSGLPRGADRTELLARFSHPQRLCVSYRGGHDVMLPLKTSDSSSEYIELAARVIMQAIEKRAALSDQNTRNKS